MSAQREVDPDSRGVAWTDREGARVVLHLTGHWRLPAIARIDATLASLTRTPPDVVDGRALDALDTAATLALDHWLVHAGRSISTIDLRNFAGPHARVIDAVRARPQPVAGTPAPPRVGGLARIGMRACWLAVACVLHVRFLGLVAVALAGVARHPSRLRWRELTAQIERVCLDAIPVVALVTLLIGVVIAYLLGLQALQYGASIFVVDGVAIGATREFSPIIVAVVLAGRSGSAFTAQLGAMRLTEEVDAIRVLGLSAVDVLVLPRVLALAIALPLLVFVGDVMSIVGAMLVAPVMLDIAPALFITRLREALDVSHFVVGLAKAPVFAVAIAVIGCRMGFAAPRDTRAVGEATTSTVVQSIVAVILLDAAFAVLFQALGI